LVFSGRSGLRLVSVVPFDLGRREVAEFAVNALFVEPRDPRTCCDLQIIETLPVTAMLGEHCGVAKEFGLKEREHRFGRGIVERIADRADRCSDVEVTESLGVGDADVLRSRVAVKPISA
jgi:hypothetical protein